MIVELYYWFHNGHVMLIVELFKNMVRIFQKRKEWSEWLSHSSPLPIVFYVFVFIIFFGNGNKWLKLEIFPIIEIFISFKKGRNVAIAKGA